MKMHDSYATMVPQSQAELLTFSYSVSDTVERADIEGITPSVPAGCCGNTSLATERWLKV